MVAVAVPGGVGHTRPMTPAAAPVAAILTTLPEGLTLGGLLRFPELVVVAEDPSVASATLRRLGSELAERDGRWDRPAERPSARPASSGWR